MYNLNHPIDLDDLNINTLSFEFIIFLEMFITYSYYNV